MATELSGAPPAAAGVLGRLRAELAGNPRAAMGLAAIGLVLLVWLATLLDAARLDADERLAEVQARAAMLERVVADPAWRERAAASDVARAAAEARLWQGTTEGLARAEFQDRLSAAAREAGIMNLQVRVDPVGGDDLPGGVSKLVAALSADFDWPSAQRLLAALASADRIQAVETLVIQTEPLPRIDLTVATYVRLGDRP
ncbi:GspMb/PilO family protein [Zavarzinia sp. CC-PAN008]|uniref:GspMb/PilO family protein n=1 Tax=Zavarzinia sp. CC-PAN008 TaxID=3243332 RepID=UPI003F7445C5